jgi:RHS repeat-associated protein
LRFPGQYYDAESGLHQNWHRSYDPALGRYISSDPIGLADGLNTFGYVGQSPLSLIDIMGLSYKEHGEAGHADLITFAGANVNGWIADMPDHALDGYSTPNFNCKKIPTINNVDFQRNNFATVCAGSGAPPINIKEYHGDLDFANIDGRWSKLSGQWEVRPGQDIFGLNLGSYTSCKLDTQESGFPAFIFPVNSFRIHLLYKKKGLPENTGVEYIERIKREIWPSLP